MIQYDAGSMLKIIFTMKGSVLKIVWPQMAFTAGLAIFATMLRAGMGEQDYIIKDIKGHSTLGTALAFLVVFRSNLSYGRYWDGRGQLGVAVKSGRELMRHVVCFTRLPKLSTEKQTDPLNPKENAFKVMEMTMVDIQRLINCLFHSMVLAVQNFDTGHNPPPYDIDAELVAPGWLTPEEKALIEKAERCGRDIPDNKGRPALISVLLSHKIYYLYHRGWMNAAVLKKCDTNVSDLIGAWMACEKIVGTPMVFPYTQMLSMFMVLFVFTFPFPLAHLFFNEEAELNGFFITPFIAALVSFAFFGMNSVGIEIENPFGDDENDLNIAGMLKRVDLDTKAMLDLLKCSQQHAERLEDMIKEQEEIAADRMASMVPSESYSTKYVRLKFVVQCTCQLRFCLLSWFNAPT
eukprot:SAG31_NODE_1850_length_7082_cov_7.264786_4_plen_406_part_00